MADLTVIEGGANQDTLAQAASFLELDDSAIPLYGITIVAFSDYSGNKTFGYRNHGKKNNPKLLALLNLALHGIMHEMEGEL